MARLVEIQDLSKIDPSITDVIMSTIASSNDIIRHDEKTTFNAGDRAYKIIDGEIVVKECTLDGTTSDDFETNWTPVDSIIGGGSATQNPNLFESISFFERKLSDDITALTRALGTVVDLSNEGLRQVFMLPLYTEDEVTVDGAIQDFARVII